MFTYILAVATVAAEASQAAVDHLDAAEHRLDNTHGQQDGEQNDVPHHRVVRVHTVCPQGLVHKVAPATPVGENDSKSPGIALGHMRH